MIKKLEDETAGLLKNYQDLYNNEMSNVSFIRMSHIIQYIYIINFFALLGKIIMENVDNRITIVLYLVNVSGNIYLKTQCILFHLITYINSISV